MVRVAPKALRGFTLLELILAMTILSFILLASTSLGTMAMRLTAIPNEGIYLNNELLYVLRDMEVRLRGAKDPIVFRDHCSQGQGVSCVCDPAANKDELCSIQATSTRVGEQTIRYSYNPTGRVLTRTIGDEVPATVTLSSGVLRPKVARVDSREELIPVFEMDGPRILKVSFRAGNAQGRTVAGMRKSILFSQDQGA